MILVDPSHCLPRLDVQVDAAALGTMAARSIISQDQTVDDVVVSSGSTGQRVESAHGVYVQNADQEILEVLMHQCRNFPLVAKAWDTRVSGA